MIKKKGIDYLDNVHFICISCYERSKGLNKDNDNSSLNQKKNINNKKHNYYADFEDGICFCYICNKKHYFTDRKANDGGCLSAGCTIN